MLTRPPSVDFEAMVKAVEDAAYANDSDALVDARDKLLAALAMRGERPGSALLKALLKACNDGRVVTFEADMGRCTLTVRVDGSHTHTGIPDTGPEAMRILEENVLAILSGSGGHLSFAEG